MVVTLTKEGRMAELHKLDSFWNLSSKPAAIKKRQESENSHQKFNKELQLQPNLIHIKTKQK